MCLLCLGWYAIVLLLSFDPISEFVGHGVSQSPLLVYGQVHQAPRWSHLGPVHQSLSPYVYSAFSKHVFPSKVPSHLVPSTLSNHF